MRGVTIDHLDIKEHVRWAHDQLELDPTYAKESALIPAHSEVLGTSSLYTSQWETLFEIRRGPSTWASFCPPMGFPLRTKRLFSYRLFPYLYWREEMEDEEEREEKEQQHLQALIKKVLEASPTQKQRRSQVEQDRGRLTNLLETIKELNQLLGQINARKLQYQRG